MRIDLLRSFALLTRMPFLPATAWDPKTQARASPCLSRIKRFQNDVYQLIHNGRALSRDVPCRVGHRGRLVRRYYPLDSRSKG